MFDKKKTILMSVVLAVALISTGIYYNLFAKPKEAINDAAKFKSEYKNVSDNNVFVYKTVDEIIKIMENGTGVVYLGYPECPWCQAYVQYLDEVASYVGISKIYYCNTKEVKEKAMDKYHKLISLLDGHLQYNDEGEQWIYVPNVSFHINGEIIGNDYETSKDTHNLKDPSEYWTDEEVAELKNNLTKYMKQIHLVSNECSTCNT